MKSKSEVLSLFREILLSLVALSKVWEYIRKDVGDLIEAESENLDQELFDRILSICEMLDTILYTIRSQALQVGHK